MLRSRLARHGRKLSILTVLGLCVGFGWYNGLPPDNVDGCALGPTSHGLEPERYGSNFDYRYGAIQSCKILDKYGHWPFGRVDTTEWLLLETDQGLVAVRLEIFDRAAARQWKAYAYELGPDDAPSEMSDDEVRRLRGDVAARGGVKTEPWIFRHGDG